MKIDYKEISKIYDKHRSYPKSLIKRIIELGKLNDGMKILDMGCGTGNLSCQLMELINVEIIGVDVSFPMLERAKNKGLEAICSDIDKNYLPFNSNAFDVIIGAYIIHQFNNLRFMFSECRRILKGGSLVLLTSSHKQIEHQHPVINKFFPSYRNVDKNRFPDIPEIECFLKAVGFMDIRYTEVLVDDFAIDQEYLKKVRNKYVSTYHLIPQKEYEYGVERLETFIRNSKYPELRQWRGTLVCGRN